MNETSVLGDGLSAMGTPHRRGWPVAAAATVGLACALAAAPAHATVDHSLGRISFPVDAHPAVQFSEGQPGFSDVIDALATLPDGTVAAAGPGDVGLAIAEVEPNGALNRSFGSRGVVHAAGAAALLQPRDLLVQADGKLLVVGASPTGAAALRLTATGAPDPSFGVAGVASLPAQADVEGAAELPDGGLLVSGSLVSGSKDSFVAEFDADGRLDLGFGSDGMALLGPAGGALLGSGESVVVRPDGSIVDLVDVGLPGGQSQTALVGLTAAGVKNPAFDGNAPVALPMVGAELLAQPDGSVLVLDAGGGVSRFTSAGRLDSTYGSGGRAVTGGADGSGPVLLAGAAGSALVVSVGLSCNNIQVTRLSVDGTASPSVFGAPAGVLPVPFGGGSFLSGAGAIGNVELGCGTFGGTLAVSQRPDGGFFLGSGVWIDVARGEGAIKTSFTGRWAIAAVKPRPPSIESARSWILDPSFSTSQSIASSVSLPRQPPPGPNGQATVVVSCASVPALASITIRANGQVIGRGSAGFLSATAHRATVSVYLSGGERLLAHGASPRVTVQVEVRDLAGNTGSAEVRGRL